ncbi:nuclear factor 7, brain-like isoform X1 [Narcine bancroftii]|uniref:nuclear factor 7, brain-like isoform X1 n=1 Tax=Narcine bancroftii TaxID=1343680 RepID=UPI0038315BA6
MAFRNQFEFWTEEVICPVCLEFLTDLVSVECGHNFCRPCIAQCWGREGRNTCPMCREELADGPLRVNRALANLAERARKLGPNPAEKERTPHCQEHREELRLLCETDGRLVCVACAGAPEHRDHRLLSIQEAVETRKEESHSLQSQITSQIADLHQILTDKEQQLLGNLREEEGRILNPMRENLQKIQENLNSLQEEFSKLQEQMYQKDNMIFLKEEAHRKRRVNEEVKTLSVTNIAQLFEKFDHPFLLNATLRGMFDGVKRVPLTLDVATVRKGFEVCKSRKSMRCIEAPLSFPNSRTRVTAWECTLGKEGFTSGRNYWEVEVSGNQVWCLGVAAESVKKKGWVPLIPDAGVWSIGQWVDGFCINTSPRSHLPDSPIPKRVGIYLRYEYGTISFYCAETMSHLHTFTGNKFTGKLYPLFKTWDENKWLRICSGPA